MNLSALDPDYGCAAEIMDEKTAALTAAAEAAGFPKKELKTASFNVNTEYRGVHDPKTGEYRQEFAGYRVFHGLTLGFPLDLCKLGELLGGFSDSGADPELSIRFTVADPEAVRREALEKAAANARKKAELLAAASGVKLGELLTIRYDWAEIRLESGGYMPLVIENLEYTDADGNPVYSMTHYGELNGDAMADPDMTFAVDFKNGTVIPRTFQNDYMGGPFVSHSFYSKDGKDIIVLEAFVFAPRYDKRQYLRQVESLLYSFEWDSEMADE